MEGSKEVQSEQPITAINNQRHSSPLFPPSQPPFRSCCPDVHVCQQLPLHTDTRAHEQSKQSYLKVNIHMAVWERQRLRNRGVEQHTEGETKEGAFIWREKVSGEAQNYLDLKGQETGRNCMQATLHRPSALIKTFQVNISWERCNSGGEVSEAERRH